jgi:hypothetical protein
MASQCTSTFDTLAQSLGGFSCRNAPAVVHFRNPFDLSNWTLPILEVTMIVGAVLALLHGIRRLRRDGDPTVVVLWFASVVYLLVAEIPLYFPDSFGMTNHVGFVFAHNVFTVEFLYDRLPLYIVALYPALATLAFEIVRVMGVFRRQGILVGAGCVGFVHHCFYEVFDHLGPQLRWWAWNNDSAFNHPMMASVPMTSIVLFAAIGPVALVFLVELFVGRRADRGERLSRGALLVRTLAAGALVPLALGIAGLPLFLFGGEHPKVTAQAVILSAMLGIVAIVAVPTLVSQWLRARRGDTDPDVAPSNFVAVFGTLYLVALGVLWATALPRYVSAVHGITSDGTPIGNVFYAGVCFVAAALCVVGALTVAARRNHGLSAVPVGVEL